jgi:hypothetical protein
MIDQPKALRLADHLEDQGYYLDGDAAAELRRLHAVNTELLDTLALALPYVEDSMEDSCYKPGAIAKMTDKIRAAIAKAEVAA